MSATAVDMLAGFSGGPGCQPTGFEESQGNGGMLEKEREEHQMDSGNDLEKDYKRLLLMTIFPFV